MPEYSYRQASPLYWPLDMSQNPETTRPIGRWYARPVIFVSDLSASLEFYIHALDFWKKWPEGEVDGPVCQINRGDCEINLCQDASRRDKARVFVELTQDELVDLRRRLADRAVSIQHVWWGYHSMKIDDPDGNEWIFPTEVNAVVTES